MVIAVVRTVILYLCIVLGIRLLGKHQVGELEPSEFVLAMIIADVAAVPMQDYGIPLLMGLIPIVTLLCLAMLLSIVSMKSLKMRALLIGVPSVVIRNGVPSEREMRRNRMTLDELLEELRLQGYTDPSAIRYGILETNGQLSLLPYAEQKPPCAGDLGLDTSDGGLPLVIINDGRLISSNLKRRGLNEAWLSKRLSENGARSVREVFLMTVDEDNQIFFARKEPD